MLRRAVPLLISLGVFSAIAMFAACTNKDGGGGTPLRRVPTDPNAKVAAPPGKETPAGEVGGDTPAADTAASGGTPNPDDADLGGNPGEKGSRTTLTSTKVDLNAITAQFFADREKAQDNVPLTGAKRGDGLSYVDLVGADKVMVGEAKKMAALPEAEQAANTSLNRELLSIGIGYDPNRKVWVVTANIDENGETITVQFEGVLDATGRMQFASSEMQVNGGLDLRGDVQCLGSRTDCKTSIFHVERYVGNEVRKATAIYRRNTLTSSQARFVVSGRPAIWDVTAPERMQDANFQRVAQLVRDGYMQKDASNGQWVQSYKYPRFSGVEVESVSVVEGRSLVAVNFKFDLMSVASASGPSVHYLELARFYGGLARNSLTEKSSGVLLQPLLQHPTDGMPASSKTVGLYFDTRVLSVSEDGSMEIEMLPKGATRGSEAILLQVKLK